MSTGVARRGRAPSMGARLVRIRRQAADPAAEYSKIVAERRPFLTCAKLSAVHGRNRLHQTHGARTGGHVRALGPPVRPNRMRPTRQILNRAWVCRDRWHNRPRIRSCQQFGITPYEPAIEVGISEKTMDRAMAGEAALTFAQKGLDARWEHVI